MEKTESVPTQSRTKTNNEKNGVLIKGTDFIMLDAPELLPSPETPLLTEAQDIVGAINELKKSSSGEGGDDWQPPEDWIPVPEPEEFEMFFLIEVSEATVIKIDLGTPEDGYNGYGALTIDWGDGTVQGFEDVSMGPDNWSVSLYYRGHTYTDAGQYLIKITATEQNSRLKIFSARDPNGDKDLSVLLIAKLGENIAVSVNDKNNWKPFKSQPILHYVKCNGFPGSESFMYCYRLKKVDMYVPAEIIPDQAFLGCYSLILFDFSKVRIIEKGGLECTAFKKINLPECVSLGNDVFYCCYSLTDFSAPKITELPQNALLDCYSLKSCYVPECLSVNSSAFLCCYKLSEFTAAENCTYTADCFKGCYSLYPRPDGSID